MLPICLAHPWVRLRFVASWKVVILGLPHGVMEGAKNQFSHELRPCPLGPPARCPFSPLFLVGRVLLLE